MAQVVSLPKNVAVDNIDFGALNVMQNGAKTVYMNINKSPIIIQSPRMRVPFALSKFTGNDDAPKGEREKWSLQLAFQDLETNTAMGNFFKFLKDMENSILNAGVTKCREWFKKELKKDVLSELCTPLLIYPKDKKTGEVTDAYPPMFRLSIPVVNGVIQCPCYNLQKEKVDLNTIEKGSKVTAIIQFTGVWIAGSKFGCTSRVLQIIVEPPTNISGYAFLPDDDDQGDHKISNNPTYIESSDDEDDLAQKRTEEETEQEQEQELEPAPTVSESEVKKGKGKKK